VDRLWHFEEFVPVRPIRCSTRDYGVPWRLLPGITLQRLQTDPFDFCGMRRHSSNLGPTPVSPDLGFRRRCQRAVLPRTSPSKEARRSRASSTVAAEQHVSPVLSLCEQAHYLLVDGPVLGFGPSGPNGDRPLRGIWRTILPPVEPALQRETCIARDDRRPRVPGAIEEDTEGWINCSWPIALSTTAGFSLASIMTDLIGCLCRILCNRMSCLSPSVECHQR
jgi:hypothetical protein